jgi:hypothetical protein
VRRIYCYTAMNQSNEESEDFVSIVRTDACALARQIPDTKLFTTTLTGTSNIRDL